MRQSIFFELKVHQFGGGGSSSSSSASTTSTTTTNNNTDKRISQQSGVAVSNTGGVTINSADAGTVQAGSAIANNAIAANTQNFQTLADLANKLFTGAGAVVANQQASLASQSQNLTSALSNQSGGVSQKTILMLGLAGVGMALMLKKKG